MESKDRMSICEKCEFFNAYLKTCRKCGCYMPAKTILKNSTCPLSKW